MTEYPTLEEILALNPHIDKEEFEKSKEILNKLRNSKAKGAGYKLALPFTHRHLFVDEGDSIDSRTITLRRLR